MSHYNVQFEHGIVENVSVEDMEVITMVEHPEHVEHEGETISEMGGMLGAVKKVVKTVIGPADQSPEAEDARMGKRRGPGTAGAPKKKQPGSMPKKQQPASMPKKQQPASMKEDADLFDIVKGHLMDEGLSEKEALEKMLTLTDEERTEMVEGSCMSGKDKKKKRK